MTNGLRRTNRGNNHTYLLDDHPVMGVTTILNQGLPKPALVPWASKVCAEYAADHWDELAAKNPSARIAAIKGAPNADRDRAARRGTEVHDLAHRLAQGHDVNVPDELKGHVDSYLRFVDQWHPAEVLLEAPVANRQHWWAGTLDLVADLADHQRWLVDIKTTRSGVYPEAALQLAAYRYAEIALVDEAETPMPEVDRVGVLWLRADGYDLVPVEADQSAYQAFRHAQQTAWWVALRAEYVVGSALTPPGDAA